MFNHKERPWVMSQHAAFKNVLEKIRQKYVVGMHFGYVFENLEDTANVDFYMSGAGTITLHKNAKTPFVKIGSRDFIPDFFAPNPNMPKYWDMAYFGHLLRRKGIEDFLQTLRMVMNKRPETKAIFLVAVPENMDESVHYTNIWQDYLKLFNAEEQKNIALFTVATKGQLYPIPSETVAHLMQQTRLLGMFSYYEGHPRVVHEALCCGVPVLVRRELKGGAHDNLDETNSRLFSTNEEAAKHALEMLEKPLTVDTQKMAQHHKATASKQKLPQELAKVFDHLGETFEGELQMDSLHRRLSGHLQDLPRKYCEKVGDDLKSPAAIACWCSDVLEQKHPSCVQQMCMNLPYTKLKAKMLLRNCVKWCIKQMKKLLRLSKRG